MRMHSSLLTEHRLEIKPVEVVASAVGWACHLVMLVGYCMLYQAVVTTAPPDLAGSLIWAVREWGIWLLVTPLVFQQLRHYDAVPSRGLQGYLKLAALVLLIAFSSRIAIAFWADEGAIAAGLVKSAPRYVAAFVTVSVIWYFFLRNRAEPKPLMTDARTDSACHRGPLSPSPFSAEDLTESRGAASVGTGQDQRYPDTLLVSKGNDECLIYVDQIACFSAAGNYVEIHKGGETFLMRSTMKQLEQLLSPSRFLRVHRSHIVNINEISRIKTQPSGNGSVQLRCGLEVGMSRKYRSQINQNHRADADLGECSSSAERSARQQSMS